MTYKDWVVVGIETVLSLWWLYLYMRWKRNDRIHSVIRRLCGGDRMV